MSKLRRIAHRITHAMGLASALALALTPAVQAQTYPTKPVRVVVPFAAGSGTDVMTRVLMEDVHKGLGAPIVIDNKPGANGSVAAELVAKAPPDGYTLLLGTSSAHSANPWLFKKLSYAPIKDFTPIARTTNFPFILVVSATTPVKSVPEFLELVRGPAEKSMGYGNSTGQVAGAHLMTSGKFKAVAVPYRSTPPALVDLVGGQFDFMFVDLASSQGLVKDGKVRPLAMMADKPSTLMPGLPALGETFPGFSYVAWGGLMGPAGLPREIVERLSREVVKSLNKPAVRERFAALGLEPYPAPPQEFASFMVEQEAAWGARIKAAGIEAE
ncbi:MAG TPA: tripartite tricarboxylate transporter substrate binding protein [Pseudorhodoferax sp.]|jgi:tripartite-type tricarboxylate transporter receptor subunit TctC|nr:tripartite tricarboxylate transporter substrate binding protein [Pseudorhodoferax sp.]